MSYEKVFDIIEKVAATTKKNEKLAILGEHKDNTKLTEVLVYTYNRFMTYGLTKRPLKEETGKEDGSSKFSHQELNLLSKLRCRTLTGGEAIQAVSDRLSDLSYKGSELLWRVISKDLRAGINESLINEVFPKLIPEFSYQRCSLLKHVKLDKFDWKAGVLSQVKADGMFLNINHELCGIVQFSTRQGHPFNMDAVPELEKLVRERITRGSQSHGEMLVFKDGVLLPRKDSNGIINHVQDGGSFMPGEEPRLVLWDQIPLEAARPKGKHNVPYKERLAYLTKQVGSTSPYDTLSVIKTEVVHSYAEAMAHALAIQRLGGEGSVFKDPWAPWEDGDSKWQVKLKLEVDVELKIVGFTQGTGKYASTFGALVLQSEDNLLEVQASGIKDKDRKAIRENWSDYLDTIATVRANDLSEIEGKKASLMHPRVIEFRKDKTKADTLQQIRDQFDAARGLK